MKHVPRLGSLVLFVSLCATLAYWAMQFFKPPVRAVAPPPPAVRYAPDINAAASLFGGRAVVTVASNYQLKGVVVAGRAADSVAILSMDGKPAQAVRINREVSPGVTVKEVARHHVMLDEGGVAKRVELPVDAKSQLAGDPAARSPLGAPSPALPAIRPVNAPQSGNAPVSAPARPATVGGLSNGARAAFEASHRAVSPGGPASAQGPPEQSGLVLPPVQNPPLQQLQQLQQSQQSQPFQPAEVPPASQ